MKLLCEKLIAQIELFTNKAKKVVEDKIIDALKIWLKNYKVHYSEKNNLNSDKNKKDDALYRPFYFRRSRISNARHCLQNCLEEDLRRAAGDGHTDLPPHLAPISDKHEIVGKGL